MANNPLGESQAIYGRSTLLQREATFASTQ